MSSGLPTVNDCCSVECEDEGVRVPGPQGASGAAGTNGTNGVNGYTTTTAGFTVPAVGSNVTIDVLDSTWMAAKSGTSGHVIFIAAAGYYEVQSKPNALSAIVKNLGYTGNAAPAAVIGTSQLVTSGGLVGATGGSGVSTLNGISPTTTKGDLMIDNGANSPAASVVRYAVGTDGQIATSQSSTATGHQWQTLLPLGTATPSDTDNRIPRFNAAAGNEEPAPLQLSSVLITDSGDIQTVGGNARGTNAVDLQTQRAAGTQVASGTQSVIAGGGSNTASGTRSFIGGGELNTASGMESAVIGGNTCSATALRSVVLGGFANISSGTASITAGTSNVASGAGAVAIGSSNTVSNDSAAALGGSNTVSGLYAFAVGTFCTASAEASFASGKESIASVYGQEAHAAGWFAALGDAQRCVFQARNATTNATPAQLWADGSAAEVLIRANTTVGFIATVIGRSDTGNTAMWKVEGCIKNNGGTTALVGTPTVTIPYVDAAITGTWGQVANVAATADNVNDALDITVTGAAVTNIRWHAVIETNEVAY